MDDTLQIKCPHCAARMRDRARKVITSYSRQCPQCEGLIFFEDTSPKVHVQTALREAERIRRELAKADEISLVTRAARFAFRRG